MNFSVKILPKVYFSEWKYFLPSPMKNHHCCKTFSQKTAAKSKVSALMYFHINSQQPISYVWTLNTSGSTNNRIFDVLKHLLQNKEILISYLVLIQLTRLRALMIIPVTRVSDVIGLCPPCAHHLSTRAHAPTSCTGWNPLWWWVATLPPPGRTMYSLYLLFFLCSNTNHAPCGDCEADLKKKLAPSWKIKS